MPGGKSSSPRLSPAQPTALQTGSAPKPAPHAGQYCTTASPSRPARRSTWAIFWSRSPKSIAAASRRSWASSAPEDIYRRTRRIRQLPGVWFMASPPAHFVRGLNGFAVRPCYGTSPTATSRCGTAAGRGRRRSARYPPPRTFRPRENSRKSVDFGTPVRLLGGGRPGETSDRRFLTVPAGCCDRCVTPIRRNP
jgi:hypothetical protein